MGLKQVRKIKETWSNRIPNLQLDRFVVDGDHPGTELNSNCQVMHRLEPFVRELKEKTWFSNSYKKKKKSKKSKKKLISNITAYPSIYQFKAWTMERAHDN